MSETPPVESEAKPKKKTWRDDERVTVTPEYFEFEILGGYLPSANRARRELEENPDNAPPSTIRMRRKLYAGDQIKLDEYPDTGERANSMALCCILTGVDYDMMARMDWQDYRLVLTACNEVSEGKA